MPVRWLVAILILSAGAVSYAWPTSSPGEAPVRPVAASEPWLAAPYPGEAVQAVEAWASGIHQAEWDAGVARADEERRAAEEAEARRRAENSGAQGMPSLRPGGVPHSDAWWWGVAICEQGGRNDPYFGYFSFMDGSQGGRTWEEQVAAGNALLIRVGREVPTWAQSCVDAGYRASPSG